MADMANTRDPKARFDIGALEQRVFSLENAVGDIAKQIAALGTKLDERARTPWVTIISAFTFLLMGISTVGWLAYRPIEQDLQRHQNRLDSYNNRYIQDLKDEIKILRAK